MEGGEPKYLLLHYPAGHWDFPKGNVEPNEDELDTVRREVKEETGIEEIRVLPGFKQSIEYYYKRDGQLVHKRVTFYLAECERSEVKLSYEHQGYVWLGYDEAIKRLTYSNARKVLAEAHKFLVRRGGLDAFLT